MKRLPDLPLELKVLATAALIYGGLAILMGFTYMVASHQGASDSAWVGVSDIAALYTGPGVGVVTLISLAHIHLLGLFAVFSIIGFIFVHSTLAPRWKIILSVLPYVAFLFDISGGFLTMYVAPGFVYQVILGGAVFILSLATMILISLYQIWFGKVGG
jgi:hypothetical protein